jgi:hypothetical protein
MYEEAYLLAIPASNPRPSAWIMPRVCASIVVILSLRENLSVVTLHFEHKEQLSI